MNNATGSPRDLFDKLKVSLRLAIGFCLVLGLLCAIAILSVAQLGRLADNTRTYATSLVPSYEVEHNVSIGLSNIRRYELQHILSNSDAEMGDIEAKVTDFYSRIQTELERFAQGVPADEQGKRFLASTRTAAAAYFEQWERVRTVSRMKAQYPSKIAEATRLSTGDSARAYEQAHAAVASWWAYNVKLANEQAVSAEQTYRSSKLVLASLTFAAIVLGGLAAVVITRSIVRQLGGEPDYAVTVADQISKGNLRVEVRLREGDSTSLLAAIKAMRDKLDGIVGQVRESADSIATGSAQIASGNIDLSQRTEEQNNSLQLTAASLQQLSVTVQASADAAGYASEAAANASQTAAAGGQVVGNVVSTMNQIAGASRRIASIISVIDDIAFQTNILALNAAVEAARAGEQGRGFAVVANEVRNLAGRSAEAAKEVKSLINASVEAVDQGSAQVVEAGESMTAIVSQVHRVSELVIEISRATVEQSAGIGQVGDSMRQLDGVTQQNAALVEQSAAAAESLRHQAETLASLVSIFQVAAGSHGADSINLDAAVESEALSLQGS